ncbi:ABC transporter permease [Mycoplasma marinum]|uniref:ABC transporter permease n=1 Tax=Mycoplasma marinum TaxID=1937190 RepID=UPI003B39F4B3
MTKYILKRLGLILISLFIILILTFFLMDLMKGYPTALSGLTGEADSGGPKNASSADNWKAFLDMPVFTRFVDFIKGIFIGKHDVTVILKDGSSTKLAIGRFGVIFDPTHKDNSLNISKVFFGPLKYSIMITLPAFVLSTILGITLGFIAGYKRGKWQDTLINVFVMFFVAVPSFVLAILFLILGKLGKMPITFDESLGTAYLIKSLIIPVLVLTLGGIATLTYYTRNEVVEILKSDFVSIARAKGLNEMQVLKRHIFRNASIPLVSIIIPSFITLLMGSFIIEIFFAVPGTSSLIVNSVSAKEIYVIEFSILFFTTLSLLASLLVDVLYVVIDPRIKIAQSQKMSIYKKMKLSLKRRNKYKNATLAKGDS